MLAVLLLPEVALRAEVYDPVPLPRPRPAVSASEQASAASATFGQGASRPAPATSEAGVLANISSYFNSFRTMQGEFIQIGPQGQQSEGVFFISRPGKIRFQYKPPVRLDVISDGRSVAIEDKKAKTQELYPYSKTPLRYLLDDRVDLTNRKLVDGVKQEADLISLVIIEKSSLVEGKLTLIFDRQTYELRQWIVTDAQGLDTSVAIFNTRTGIRPDPNLFRIYLQR